MTNLEPSWLAVGDIVAEQIGQSNIPPNTKAELLKIVLQMASIAHYARANHYQEQLRSGELSPHEAPSWALESLADSY